MNIITREERMKQIGDVFEKDPNKTLKEIGEELGLSQSAISNYLSQYFLAKRLECLAVAVTNSKQ